MTKRVLKKVAKMTVVTLALVSVLEGVRAQESFGNAAARAEFERAEAAQKRQDFAKAASFYRAAIELDPYFVQAHKSFINNAVTVAVLSVKADLPIEERRQTVKKARAATHKEMVTLYEEWIQKNPRNPVYQWALSELYRLDENYNERERYLLEAIKLAPKFVPAYRDLAVIAELRGDKNKQRRYLKIVAEHVPHDSSSLYHYAQSLQDVDPVLYREKMLEVVNRFPNDERGAQAFLQLAVTADKPAERIALLEQLRTSFPPSRFMYSNAGMPDLFDSYSRAAPGKARALAEEMSRIATQEGEKKMWRERAEYQQNVVRARTLADEKKYHEALVVLEQSAALKPEFIKDGGFFDLLRAEAFAGAGQPALGYQELLQLATSQPTDGALERLLKAGASLGKTARQVNADIRQALGAKAKPVRNFLLPRYGDEKQVSPADYLGKVVMLSFWFPTCAPCRVQNRELKKILKKYGPDRFVILAINVRPEQDQFVLPYLRNNQLNFVPLRGSADFARNEFQTTSYPTEFLLDRQGRVVFELSEVRGEAIRTMELQIEMLLENNGD